MLAAVSTSGIIFSSSEFEQADQLAGEREPPARHPAGGDRRDHDRRDHLHPAADRVPGGAPGLQIGGTWADSAYTTFSGPFAQLATLVGAGWLATILYIDAVISPAGTGLIYTTAASRVSYGLSRNGYIPTVYERTDKRGSLGWPGSPCS